MPHTRGQLRTIIHQRCDIENSTHETDAETNGHINDASAYVHDFLIQTFGPRYCTSGSTVVTVAGDNTYDLPDDFYRPVSIGLITDELVVPLSSLELSSVPLSTTSSSWGLGAFPEYHIQTTINNVWEITFNPPPDGVKTVNVIYHPTHPTFDDDADVVIFPQNAIDLLVLEAVVRIKDKEERDTSRYERERSMIQERIQAWASPVDTMNPQGTTDTRFRKGFGPLWRNRIF